MAHHSSFESLEIYKEAILFRDAIWELSVPNARVQNSIEFK